MTDIKNMKQRADDSGYFVTDYIKREDAIEAIASRDETDGTVKVFAGREVNEILSNIPPADVVEVVR